MPDVPGYRLGHTVRITADVELRVTRLDATDQQFDSGIRVRRGDTASYIGSMDWKTAHPDVEVGWHMLVYEVGGVGFQLIAHESMFELYED